MRVTFAVPGGLDGLSGGHRYNRQLVDHLRAAGDDVEVVGLPEQSPGRAVFGPLPSTVRQQLNRSADVLLIDGLCHPAVVGAVPTLDGPDAVVALVHYLRSASPNEGPSAIARWLEATFADTVDAAVVTSDHTREQLKTLAEMPMTVAYPGGRRDSSPPAETVRTRTRNQQFRVAFVGALTPRKQPIALVDALAQFDTGVEADWHASLVGPADVAPAYAARVEVAIESAGLGESVDVAGVVDDKTLTDTLNQAHVLVAPSLYEPFGMVVLEAMERGTVPIATTAGGPPEFVTDGESGILVDPSAVGQIGELLTELARDRSRLESLALGATQAAQEQPDWEQSLSKARDALADTANVPVTAASTHQGDR